MFTGFGEDGHVKSFIELAGAAVKFHNTGQWFVMVDTEDPVVSWLQICSEIPEFS